MFTSERPEIIAQRAADAFRKDGAKQYLKSRHLRTKYGTRKDPRVLMPERVAKVYFQTARDIKTAIAQLDQKISVASRVPEALYTDPDTLKQQRETLKRLWPEGN